MMRRLFVLVACLAGLGGLAASNDGELLPNPGFEQGLVGWTRGYGDVRVVEIKDAPEGRRCVYIRGPGAIRSGFIPYRGGYYRLAFWMKTRGVKAGPRRWNRACVQITYFGQNRKPVGKGHFDLASTLGTTPWTRHETTLHFEAKIRCRYFRINASMWNCTGEAWFDGVELRPCAPPKGIRELPTREEAELNPIRVWPMPAVRPGPARISLGPVDLTFDRDHLLKSLAYDWHGDGHGEPCVTAFHLEPSAQRTKACGYDVQTGYLVRRKWIADDVTFEGYVERMRGSRLVHILPRVWLPLGRTVKGLGATFEFAPRFDTVIYFEGDEPVRRHVEPPNALDIRLGRETTKPFIALQESHTGRGVAMFHPLPAEVRQWFTEDYVVAARPTVQVTVQVRANGTTLKYRMDRVTAPKRARRASLDFYYCVCPFTGAPARALDMFRVGRGTVLSPKAQLPAKEFPRGYWQEFMPASPSGAHTLRHCRYFPFEGYSFTNAGGKLFSYGHDRGHAWGYMTLTLKGVRASVLTDNDWARDRALRLMQFFLDRADDRGAPPSISMYAPRARDPKYCRRPEDFYRMHFCQHLEYMLPLFYQFLVQSSVPSAEDKQRVYSQLQRLRALFDPARQETTWTVIVDDGAYWFKYMDIIPSPHYVINTHTTNVGNAGWLMRIASDMHDETGFRFWQRLFRRGVDGLLWCLDSDWIWNQNHDPNELLYARPGYTSGRAVYHFYMVSTWMPTVIRHAAWDGNYRLDELVASLRRMMKARVLRSRPRFVRNAEKVLREVGR